MNNLSPGGRRRKGWGSGSRAKHARGGGSACANAEKLSTGGAGQLQEGYRILTIGFCPKVPVIESGKPPQSARKSRPKVPVDKLLNPQRFLTESLSWAEKRPKVPVTFIAPQNARTHALKIQCVSGAGGGNRQVGSGGFVADQMKALGDGRRAVAQQEALPVRLDAGVRILRLHGAECGQEDLTELP